MAIQKIEYENKVSIEDLPDVLEKNKVTADNMNEIKSIVNNNADELTTTNTNMFNKSNIVSSVSMSSTNEQVPGAKLFYDTIGELENVLETLDTGTGV